MTTATKCRAKNPVTCTDPNCPEKRAHREAFFADFASASSAATLPTVPSVDPLYGIKNADRFNSLYQASATAIGTDPACRNLPLEEQYDKAYQHLLGVYTNEVKNKSETKFIREHPEAVKDAFRWFATANIDDPLD